MRKRRRSIDRLTTIDHVNRYRAGVFVSNRASDKMVALNDWTIMCRSGSAADTEALAGYVRKLVSEHEMELDAPADVKTVATITNQIGYQNKGMNNGRGMSAYTIVGGWDARRGAQVYACTAGGNMVKERWTTDGSGSTYIWGFLDDGWREGMTREECEAFVARAIALAARLQRLHAMQVPLSVPERACPRDAATAVKLCRVTRSTGEVQMVTREEMEGLHLDHRRRIARAERLA